MLQAEDNSSVIMRIHGAHPHWQVAQQGPTGAYEAAGAMSATEIRTRVARTPASLESKLDAASCHICDAGILQVARCTCETADGHHAAFCGRIPCPRGCWERAGA